MVEKTFEEQQAAARPWQGTGSAVPGYGSHPYVQYPVPWQGYVPYGYYPPYGYGQSYPPYAYGPGYGYQPYGFWPGYGAGYEYAFPSTSYGGATGGTSGLGR